MNEIKEQLKCVPEMSGSYQFFDDNNEIIYVGKAKNLKKRVSSYFQKKHESPKLLVMVPQVSRIEFIVTDTEIEALILESHLIKKYKPKYNVLLKDDKKFPYFVFTDEEYPRIIVARKRNKNPIKGKYFGPYTDARAMYATLDLIKKLFPLKQCKTPRFKSRPCIYYQINRCSAPCQKLITTEEYKKILKNVELFLLGKQNELVKQLKKQMDFYAQKEDFEKAARYRDSYFDVLKTMEKQKVIFESTKINQDIIAIVGDDNAAAVTLLQVRSGRLIDKKDFEYSFYKTIESKQEVMTTFLSEYYELNSELGMPAEVVLQEKLSDDDMKLYADWLSQKAKFIVKVKHAKSTKDKELLHLAQKNADVFFNKMRFKKLVELQNDYNEIGAFIQEKLNLQKFPHTVECFDISHIQGTNTVASMVVFENGMPKKSEYRKYKIRSTEDKPDDFKSMQEVVERRYKRLLRENKPFPDLIIIDGGKGQLSSVMEIMKKLDIKNQDIIALAKRLEEIFLPDCSTSTIFAQTSSVLHFFQRIRDEAHRFAITFHRQLRAKEALRSKNYSDKKNQT